ncbi:hypothetical protein VTN02DRAFT_3317 [Thermoascus thermophilus]
MAEPQRPPPTATTTSTSQESPDLSATDNKRLRIAIVGAGTIGVSFAALHLAHPANRRRVQVVVYDPRPDLREYLEATLPGYLDSFASNDATTLSHLLATHTLRIASSLSDAVATADIVQEQGPETLAVKQALWPQIESLAPSTALFWSSTSGIPASVQGRNMRDPGRLLVVHPYNPPHVMPLLEIVPPASTAGAGPSPLQRTLDYWHRLDRTPVVLKEEITGFVANRLAFALLREAIDRVVESSMGPRWAVRGPFWSYHAGGGPERGLRGFFDKIGETVQACWADAGAPVLHDGDGWLDALCEQVERSYGRLGREDLDARDETTRRVLEVTCRLIPSSRGERGPVAREET